MNVTLGSAVPRSAIAFCTVAACMLSSPRLLTASAQGELGPRVQMHDAIRLLLAAHHHALDTAVVTDVLAGHINLRADVESHQEDAAAQVHVESEGNGGG